MTGNNNIKAEEKRPSPDQLLAIVQRGRRREGRGNLKVFLGMVAGVGKTFAMLQRAHQLKLQGTDVVIGWIDAHGRRETEMLIQGLDVLPQKAVIHRGIEIQEMDLEAILARKPRVVIVDELAHTNVPGLRHEKRYQDVLEIVNAGIDVFTAVNIQHIESRVDTVKEITGVIVHETVPDLILDEADEIVLIDLPADDLLLRLKEGRIYPPERAETAGRNFFTRGNLTALRELALRVATGRVDRDLRDFKTLHGIEAAWKSGARLMVAVFESPYSNSLIRWTRQLADTMRGTWIGVYVDVGKTQNDVEKSLLEKNTELVRKLGGEFVSTQDQDLVDGLLRVARQQNVTQIIVGKTQRWFLKNLLSGGSVVDRLLRKSGDIDVYAVATDKEKSREHRKIKGKISDTKTLSLSDESSFYPWSNLSWIVSISLFSWLMAALLNQVIDYEAIGILFLIIVTLSGLALSWISVFAIAVILSLVHNFFFIPPLYTFAIDKPRDILMVAMFFIAASVTGYLTARLKKQNTAIQNREEKAFQSFKLAHAIAEAKDLNRVISLGIEMLDRIFSAQTAVILTPESEDPKIHHFSTLMLEDKEIAVAKWVQTNGQMAGQFTETLSSSASATFFPIQAKDKVLGAIAIRLPKGKKFDYEARNYAYILVNQINTGIEREMLHESRKRLDALEQADRLYRSLFDSVSHELKTPLTTIKGAAAALKNKVAELKESKLQLLVNELSSHVESESERLIDVVDNMLDMTRIESNALKTALQLVDVPDILGPVLHKIGNGSFDIETFVDEGISAIKCDPVLTVQALINILKNAISYSGHTPVIKLDVVKAPDDTVEFRIKDNGPGFSEKEIEQVFERFYRRHPEKVGGLGLGLSIARGFIEAQGGSITASNAPGGGAIFTIKLATEQ